VHCCQPSLSLGSPRGEGFRTAFHAADLSPLPLHLQLLLLLLYLQLFLHVGMLDGKVAVHRSRASWVVDIISNLLKQGSAPLMARGFISSHA
jgi:hypothetical protein